MYYLISIILALIALIAIAAIYKIPLATNAMSQRINQLGREYEMPQPTLDKPSDDTDELLGTEMQQILAWIEKKEIDPKETPFILPYVQERYDQTVNALKYTKHSKKREQLLKRKKYYEQFYKGGI